MHFLIDCAPFIDALTRWPVPFIEGPLYRGPETREIASQDPKAFLAGLSSQAIIDEIQRVPELLSYIQVAVDQEGRNGRFVLTGSHQLNLREGISQTLAGRTAILHLLPLSIAELSAAGRSFDDFEHYAFTGFLPRIYEQSQRPSVAYANYYQTYVERDVRQIIRLKDASLFEKTLKIVAGRSGQLADYNSIANDVGVDAKTIRDWLSVFEASFILFKLPPYFENFGKRVIKATNTILRILAYSVICGHSPARTHQPGSLGRCHLRKSGGDGMCEGIAKPRAHR